MKKLIFLSSLLGFSTAALAQLPVSTSTENKNAVLEEFTGIYCTFCPDGHLRASQFAAANPGDVVLINIHEGGYANPNGNDPDFRTPWGSAIAGQSGLTGYPAGTMNRRVFPGNQQGSGTAQSRGSWATTGATVIGEGSYANIALEATIDFATNTLTVDVETYFTGSSAVTMAKLNVAVLQNNVEGPQVGAAANPTQVLANGNYNHMLRELLTGQWGADIPTTMNTVGSYSYTWTIPADINNIPVSLGDLEVVAFIAEGQQDIITGAKGPITYNLPAGMSLADAGATSSMTIPAGFCNTSIIPEFTVENNEPNALDSIEAVMVYNGGAPVSQWVTNVPANGSQVVTFPSINLVPGVTSIGFSVSVANVAKYVDVNASNNGAASGDIIVINPNPFATFHFEGFESNAIGQGAPDNSIQINPTGARVYAVDNTINSSVTWDIGGNGNSSKSYRFDYFAIGAGEVVDLVFEKLDLSSTTGNLIRFEYAYAQYASENDALDILVSDDCGATWNSVWSKAGAQLSTAGATTSRFYPQAGDWDRAAIDISAYDGTAELLVKFSGTSAFGNDLYVDDIYFFNNAYVSLEEEEMLSSVSVYPNPAVGSSNVEFELANDAQVSVKLTDLTGKLIAQPINGEMAAGNHKTAIDVSNLESGVYLVEIILDGNTKIEKLIVE